MNIDEKLKQGLMLIMENYWIIRDEKPKEYAMVRSVEKDLKKLVSERFGWSLFVSVDFIKCEKIPAQAFSWMGVKAFNKKLDYVLFCCLLSYLEEKNRNSFFMLREICLSLKALYPGNQPLEWTNYQNRKALIRVIKQAIELRIIKQIDGDLDAFASKEDSEVLYCSTIFSRYFMRSYPLNIREHQNINTLNEAIYNESDPKSSSRFKVYRHLFLQPALFRSDVDDATFLYLRNQRSKIQAMVNTYSDFRFDLNRDYASLALEESTSKYKIFPESRMVDDIILQLGAKIQTMGFNRDEFGAIHLETYQWLNLIKAIKRESRYGWSKEFRETLSLEEVAKRVLEHAIGWHLCSMNGDNIIIKPTLSRFSGEYPKEFKETRHGK